MPQLSLYLTEEQYAKLKNEARSEHVSLSKWVADRILNTINPQYPEGWGELFGSVSDASFTRPEQPRIDAREAL